MACSGCVNRLSFCCLSAQSILLVSCAFWLGSHAAPVQHRGHWPEAADLATLAAPNCSLLTLWSAEQLQITARPLLPPNSIVSHAYLNCLAFDRRGFAKEVVFTVVDNDNALRQLHFVCTHNGSLEMDLFGFPNPTNTGETCRGCRNATESCDVCDLSCQNGGTLLSDCSRCLCMPLYTGRQCETLNPQQDPALTIATIEPPTSGQNQSEVDPTIPLDHGEGNATDGTPSEQPSVVEEQVANATEGTPSEQPSMAEEQVANATEGTPSEQTSMAKEQVANATEGTPSEQTSVVTEEVANATEDTPSEQPSMVKEQVANATEDTPSEQTSMVKEQVANATEDTPSEQPSVVTEQVANATEDTPSEQTSMVKEQVANATEGAPSEQPSMATEQVAASTPPNGTTTPSNYIMTTSNDVIPTADGGVPVEFAKTEPNQIAAKPVDSTAEPYPYLGKDAGKDILQVPADRQYKIHDHGHPTGYPLGGGNGEKSGVIYAGPGSTTVPNADFDWKAAPVSTKVNTAVVFANSTATESPPGVATESPSGVATESTQTNASETAGQTEVAAQTAESVTTLGAGETTPPTNASEIEGETEVAAQTAESVTTLGAGETTPPTNASGTAGQTEVAAQTAESVATLGAGETTPPTNVSETEGQTEVAAQTAESVTTLSAGETTPPTNASGTSGQTEVAAQTAESVATLGAGETTPPTNASETEGQTEVAAQTAESVATLGAGETTPPTNASETAGQTEVAAQTAESVATLGAGETTPPTNASETEGQTEVAAQAAESATTMSAGETTPPTNASETAGQTEVAAQTAESATTLSAGETTPPANASETAGQMEVAAQTAQSGTTLGAGETTPPGIAEGTVVNTENTTAETGVDSNPAAPSTDGVHINMTELINVVVPTMAQDNTEIGTEQNVTQPNQTTEAAEARTPHFDAHHSAVQTEVPATDPMAETGGPETIEYAPAWVTTGQNASQAATDRQTEQNHSIETTPESPAVRTDVPTPNATAETGGPETIEYAPTWVTNDRNLTQAATDMQTEQNHSIGTTPESTTEGTEVPATDLTAETGGPETIEYVPAWVTTGQNVSQAATDMQTRKNHSVGTTPESTAVQTEVPATDLTAETGGPETTEFPPAWVTTGQNVTQAATDVPTEQNPSVGTTPESTAVQTDILGPDATAETGGPETIEYAPAWVTTDQNVFQAATDMQTEQNIAIGTTPESTAVQTVVPATDLMAETGGPGTIGYAAAWVTKDRINVFQVGTDMQAVQNPDVGTTPEPTAVQTEVPATDLMAETGGPETIEYAPAWVTTGQNVSQVRTDMQTEQNQNIGTTPESTAVQTDVPATDATAETGGPETTEVAAAWVTTDQNIFQAGTDMQTEQNHSIGTTPESAIERTEVPTTDLTAETGGPETTEFPPAWVTTGQNVSQAATDMPTEQSNSIGTTPESTTEETEVPATDLMAETGGPETTEFPPAWVTTDQNVSQAGTNLQTEQNHSIGTTPESTSGQTDVPTTDATAETGGPETTEFPPRVTTDQNVSQAGTNMQTEQNHSIGTTPESTSGQTDVPTTDATAETGGPETMEFPPAWVTTDRTVFQAGTDMQTEQNHSIGTTPESTAVQTEVPATDLTAETGGPETTEFPPAWVTTDRTVFQAGTDMQTEQNNSIGTTPESHFATSQAEQALDRTTPQSSDSTAVPASGTDMSAMTTTASAAHTGAGTQQVGTADILAVPTEDVRTFTAQPVELETTQQSTAGPEVATFMPTTTLSDAVQRETTDAEVATSMLGTTEVQTTAPQTTTQPLTTTLPTTTQTPTATPLSTTQHPMTTTTLAAEVIITTATDPCLVDPCQNNGTCSRKGAGEAYTCECQLGFEGKNCETDVDECALRGWMCLNGGTCIDQVNDFSCECAAGFTGAFCAVEINECESEPCLNGAQCIDGLHQYTCLCAAGFSGANCEVNVDDCAGLPGDVCMNGGQCRDLVGTFDCACAPGFTGPWCGVNIDECGLFRAICQNEAKCVDGINNFTCQCPPGFDGHYCEVNIDDCVNVTCENAGECVDAINAHWCKCAEGFGGNFCEVPAGGCGKPSPCQNGGQCIPIGAEDYHCACSKGFVGSQCQHEVNECQASPCQNDGVCIDKVSGFSCHCTKAFWGKHCEYSVDHCWSNPCQNNASCLGMLDSYFCTCTDGFVGRDCQLSVAAKAAPAKTGGQPPPPEPVIHSPLPKRPPPPDNYFPLGLYNGRELV